MPALDAPSALRAVAHLDVEAGARAGAPPAGLPDTATRRGSGRRRRHSPGTPRRAPHGFRRPAPGTVGVPALRRLCPPASGTPAASLWPLLGTLIDIELPTSPQLQAVFAARTRSAPGNVIPASLLGEGGRLPATRTACRRRAAPPAPRCVASSGRDFLTQPRVLPFQLPKCARYPVIPLSRRRVRSPACRFGRTNLVSGAFDDIW